jgi:TonB family protein
MRFAPIHIRRFQLGENGQLRIMKNRWVKFKAIKATSGSSRKFGKRRKNAMFNELIESSSEKKKTNTGWSVILSAIVQVSALSVLILIPLIYTQALPKAMLATLLVAPPPPPPPPPPPKAAAPVRIKQGGEVTAASIITQTRPVYPALARQARIQGTVLLHAIIDKDGQVAKLEVVSGHPLLVQSALDAVKQWRYKPTQLNGDPVEVDTTIQVTFTMGA